MPNSLYVLEQTDSFVIREHCNWPDKFACEQTSMLMN